MAVANRVRDLPQRLTALTFRPVWLVLAVVALAHALGLSLPVVVGYGVLLVTLLVLGLPHGALDHVTVPRARATALSARWLGLFSLGYLLLAGLYTVAWFLAPTASFLFFVLLTWYHWGQGDRAHLALAGPEAHVEGWVGRLTVLVRGGLPMLVPLLGFPERYRSVMATVVGLFDPDGGQWLAPLFQVETRLALGLGFAAVTVVTLAMGYRVSGATVLWRRDAIETALLWVFFLTVPPVLAIGLYFALWHSLRHVVRVLGLEQESAAGERGGLRRLVWDGAPTTLGALVIFGALALFVPEQPGSLAGVGGVYLVLLAVLTLPHVVVVTWLDRFQAVA